MGQGLNRAGLLCVLLAAAGLRFVAPLAWPIFCDEDNYAYAVQQLHGLPWTAWTHDIARCCVKPPLLLAVAEPISRWLGSELLALRMLSALAGLVSVGACYGLGRKLGGADVGLATAALYASSPWTVLHERMALLDGPLAALALLAALVTWESMDRGSWRLALLAGVLGGAAVLTKQAGLISLGAPLLLALLLWRRQALLPGGIALLGSALSWMAVRLAAGGDDVEHQLLERWSPLEHVGENWVGLRDAVGTYLPLPAAALVLVGALVLVYRRPRHGLFVIGQLLAWSATWVAVSNFAPSRYYLPALPYACALMAYGFLEGLASALNQPASRRWAGAAGLAALVGWSAFASASLVLDHGHAAMSQQDDWQYRSGWPSGYGYPEARAFVLARAQAGDAVACLFSGSHRVAAGCDRMPGLNSLGNLDPASAELSTQLAVARGPVLVIAELEEAELRACEARLGGPQNVTALAHFPRFGGSAGPAVLRVATQPAVPATD